MIKVEISPFVGNWRLVIFVDGAAVFTGGFCTRTGATSFAGAFLRRLCAASNKLLDQKRFLK